MVEQNFINAKPVSEAPATAVPKANETRKDSRRNPVQHPVTNKGEGVVPGDLAGKYSDRLLAFPLKSCRRRFTSFLSLLFLMATFELLVLRCARVLTKDAHDS